VKRSALPQGWSTSDDLPSQSAMGMTQKNCQRWKTDICRFGTLQPFLFLLRPSSCLEPTDSKSQAAPRRAMNCPKSRVFGNLPAVLQPRELNLPVGCSKKLTAGRPVSQGRAGKSSNSQMSLGAVPRKGCSAAEVSGRHHEPRLPRGCFPGPVRPYGVAYKQPFPAKCFHSVITSSYLYCSQKDPSACQTHGVLQPIALTQLDFAGHHQESSKRNKVTPR
jgi:hypothetical protein